MSKQNEPLNKLLSAKERDYIVVQKSKSLTQANTVLEQNRKVLSFEQNFYLTYEWRHVKGNSHRMTV